jgi:hypothetical protein
MEVAVRAMIKPKIAYYGSLGILEKRVSVTIGNKDGKKSGTCEI